MMIIPLICLRFLIQLFEWTNKTFDVWQGTYVSMGVYSDGSYNVPPGIVYSFPVTCANGDWTIVQGNFCLRNFYISHMLSK